MFQRALQSVVEQTFQAREIIVVVDGSDEQSLHAYQELAGQHPGIHFEFVQHRPSGHGQSYSMNVGAHAANGDYLCFLDDDDCWSSERHLENAATSIRASDEPVDLYYTNQQAYFADGVRQTEEVWLESLIGRVSPDMQVCGNSYRVDASFLMQGSGFAHLNCSIVNRQFYHSLGGMDESIRYENDHDFYLRAVDAARVIIYCTDHVSRHNIPDTSKRDNMSTVGSDIEKKLYQIRVYDKGICGSSQQPVLALCLRGKTYELKHAARILASRGQYRRARHYAAEALLSGFNLRWLGYTCYLGVRGLLHNKPNG